MVDALVVGNYEGQNALAAVTSTGSLIFLLVTELLNSGIEAVVDRIGPELHPLSGFAKDCGSAAVLFALIFALIVWLVVLFTIIFG